MKTRVNFKRLLVAAGTFFVFAVISKAENNENVRVFFLDQKKVLLLVSNPEKQRVMLNISDNQVNQNLFSDRISKDMTYRKLFDLSVLPEGTYRFTVEFEDKVFEKEVRINDGKAELTAESVYYPPDFKVSEDYLSVSYLNPSMNQVSVSFIRENDSFFKDQLPENVGSFKRDYNLKYLNPGNYQVQVSTGNKSYIHTFEKY